MSLALVALVVVALTPPAVALRRVVVLGDREKQAPSLHPRQLVHETSAAAHRADKPLTMPDPVTDDLLTPFDAWLLGA